MFIAICIDFEGCNDCSFEIDGDDNLETIIRKANVENERCIETVDRVLVVGPLEDEIGIGVIQTYTIKQCHKAGGEHCNER